jgi:uncharacterized protein YjlB
MSIRESLKKTLETVTGINKPSAGAIRSSVRPRKPRTLMFKDDGETPNNPRFPFVSYRSVVGLAAAKDPAAVFEELFEANGWVDAWRDGIYDYLHYHSRTHEVLGIARGKARVRFGGNHGKILELQAGDVAILPAGTGHQRISASKDFLVVGAYPESGTYDECTSSAEDHDRALRSIPKVSAPPKDPVFGAKGPLRDVWRTKSGRSAKR